MLLRFRVRSDGADTSRRQTSRREAGRQFRVRLQQAEQAGHVVEAGQTTDRLGSHPDRCRRRPPFPYHQISCSRGRGYLQDPGGECCVVWKTHR